MTKHLLSSELVSDSLLTDNFTTNRILEIPQDIKLELNNGTLTLKAGSKVYVPNGFETNGTTPKFNIVNVQSDSVFAQTSASGNNFLFYTGGNAVTRHVNAASGTNIPSGFTGIFYNTATNHIYYCNNGTRADESFDSFPIAIITIADNQTANVSSIDQIFNGFGYIGSTAFALPGVKYQFADGRNEDGTYKTITKTFDKVSLTSYSYQIKDPNRQPLSINDQGILIRTEKYFIQNNQPVSYDSVWYKPKTNEIFRSNGSGVYGKSREIIIANDISTNSAFNITSFEPLKVPTINSYQRAELTGMGMPSSKYIDLTPGASGTPYTAPANGWFSAYNANGANGFCSLTNETKKIGSCGSAASGITDGLACVPVSAGDTIILRYSDTFNSLHNGWFRFIYANGYL